MANPTSTFIKKNIVTVIILGATVVLAAIAIFTAVRLYQLRQEPVAPNEPGSSPAAAGIISTVPKSGNWNLPGSFVLTNNSSQSVQLRYHLDCWEESVCGDKEEQATVTLAAGQSIEKGLGVICSKWQLDINWTGGQGWDWGGISEKTTNCTVVTPTPSASPSPSPSATPSGSASPTPSPSGTPKSSPSPSPTGSPIACSLTFSFTLKGSSPTPTATPTEPPRGGSPTPTPTTTGSASPTPTPSGSTTPKPSVTPTPGIGGVATATPAALPAAGATLPTILGIGAGFLLLMGSILLAL